MDGHTNERAIEEATGEPVSTAVLALGPLTRNHELLARGTLSVKGKQFKIKSADKRHFTARVH